jgi:hypothetical protein
VVFAEAQDKDVVEPVREEDGELERERKEKLPKTKADIARCWAKYCLNLIRDGKEKQEKEVEAERLQSENETEEIMEGEGEASKADSIVEEDENNKNPLRFQSLEVTCYEQLVPDRIIKNVDEVRLI